jgi:hypothetical protein
MSFGVKRPGMVYGPRGGVTPGLFGIHIPIIDDVINTAGKIAAATGIPVVSQLGRAADLAVKDRQTATATKATSVPAVTRVSTPPIVEQASSQTPFPALPPAPGSIDINPPLAGAPGAGVNITTSRGQLQLGVAQQPAAASSSGGQMVQRGGGQLGPVSVQPAVFAETVHRCPTGWVLAIDNNCYPKSMVPRSMRKWKPRRKGPISRRKWKALLDADAAAKTAKRVAEKAGFITRKRK